MYIKRFTLGVCESGLGLTDNETKEQYLEVDDTTLIRLCEVLNGLSEENEQLKKQLSDVRKENYGNLDGINYYQEQNASLSERISDLECENEQLKQFQDTVFVLINEMIETANHYRTPIKSLDHGEDLGYWNGVYQKLKELREILEKRKRS